MYVYHELCTACAFSDGCPKGLRYSVKKKVVVTDSSMYMCMCTINPSCLQAISIFYSSKYGLKGYNEAFMDYVLGS